MPRVARVWIFLDSRYPPYEKILDEEEAQFQISPEELKSVLAFAKTDPEIELELRKHLGKKGDEILQNEPAQQK